MSNTRLTAAEVRDALQGLHRTLSASDVSTHREDRALAQAIEYYAEEAHALAARNDAGPYPHCPGPDCTCADCRETISELEQVFDVPDEASDSDHCPRCGCVLWGADQTCAHCEREDEAADRAKELDSEREDPK